MALAPRVVHESSELRLARVACDGVDPPRPEAEPTRGDRIVVVLRGAFELRGRERMVADPSRAVVLRDGAEHVFRHPSGGGDVCLAVSGAVAQRIAAEGPTVHALAPRAWSRLHALAVGAANDVPLAIEEALRRALAEPALDRSPNRPHRERALADEIALRVQRRVDGRITLGELARDTGYSEFQLCRVFHRARGHTIGAFLREQRLRHALALLVDTARPIAEVAIDTGFASQAHLTTQFRARFGVTPRRARLDGGV